MILTGLALFLIYKYGFGVMLLVTGVLLLGAGFLGLVYEVGTVVVTGFILLVVGLFLVWRGAKKKALGGMFGSSGGFNVGKYYNQGTEGYRNRYEKWAKGEKEESENLLVTLIKLPFKILFFPIKFLFLPSGEEARNRADEMAEESARKRGENYRKWQEEEERKKAEKEEKERRKDEEIGFV